MRVRAFHGIDRLQADQEGIVKRIPRAIVGVAREGAKVGNDLAKADARRTAGKHGKHYPRAFTSEVKKPAFLVAVGDYGPVVDRRQGDMSFEDGSRNQKPHRSLAKSFDVIVPAFHGEVKRMVGGWFW